MVRDSHIVGENRIPEDTRSPTPWHFTARRSLQANKLEHTKKKCAMPPSIVSYSRHQDDRLSFVTNQRDFLNVRVDIPILVENIRISIQLPDFNPPPVFFLSFSSPSILSSSLLRYSSMFSSFFFHTLFRIASTRYAITTSPSTVYHSSRPFCVDPPTSALTLTPGTPAAARGTSLPRFADLLESLCVETRRCAAV